MQTRAHSLIESLTNIAVGLAINTAAQIILFPLFGIHIPVHANITIAVIFTVISLVRSYSLRRIFNGWHQKKV